MKSESQKGPLVELRNSIARDVDDIANLLKIARPSLEKEYPLDSLRAPMQHYPEGQFVVYYEGKLVGYCSTFRIAKELAFRKHTWDEITGYGFAALHDPYGDFLYCMDLCVHPDYQDLKIESRLEKARKHLCRDQGLKGVVVAGKLMNYWRHRKRYPTVKEYLHAVLSHEVIEPELSNKLQAHFHILDVLEDYNSGHDESHKQAIHMVWYNPATMGQDVLSEAPTFGFPRMVRVSLIQYKQRKIESFEQFSGYVEYYVNAVSKENADFVLFPELFTLQLLSMHRQNLSAAHSILTLSDYTETVAKMMRQLAVKYNVNIIGGSHPTSVEGRIHNISSVYLRNGEVHCQFKLHPGSNERYCWGVHGGEKLRVIDTDCGPIAVLICYDCEFPELARIVAQEGARIIFVPFAAEERRKYLRIRYCAQARAIENQCYVAIAGNVGNLPGVPTMDVQYAQSCIFTPSDFAFARDGIAVDAPINVEMVAYADLSMEDLDAIRMNSSASHLKDRRSDLYCVQWCSNKDDFETK